MPSVLFICTANQFRSPLAALYFAREVVRHGDDEDFRVASAGVWTRDGRPATDDVIEFAQGYALNLSFHKSRVVTEEILKKADLILVMEAGQKEALSQEFPYLRAHIYLLTEAVGQPPYDIPDPYKSKEPYHRIGREIIQMIDRGYDPIIKLAQEMAQNAEKTANLKN
jgi:protein-tyrosine phosphatase